MFVEFINILNVGKYIVFVFNHLPVKVPNHFNSSMQLTDLEKKKQLVEFLVRMFHNYFLYDTCYAYSGIIYLTNSFFFR